MASPSPRSPAQPKHILSNTGWNMLGRIAPIFVALLVTPKLIHLLGLSRWGVFSIALSLVGTFGIFDFGLGRALTRTIADRATDEPDEETADVTLTGIITLTVFGVIGGLIAAVAVAFWVHHGLKIPSELERQTTIALWVLCATAPLVMANAAMWGVMTAFQAFRAANLVNIPISIMYYLGPLLALLVWNNLIGVMLVLAACRLWMTVSYLRICLRLMPQIRTARARPRLLAPLFRVGGWMTVSNIAYPVLNYMDRFMIASVISAAATSYYTTPADVVGRFSLLTNAVTGSAFPAFAASWRRDVETTVALYRTSVLTIQALLFPVCLFAALFSHPLLALWIDPSFATQSSTIMKFLCLGVFISGVDSIAAGFLDGIGRPDASAKLSIGEFLVYTPLLYICLVRFGVIGAAFAWALRMTLDFIVRSWVSVRLYRPLGAAIRRILPAAVVGFLALVASLVEMSLSVAALAFVVLSAVFYGVLWFGCMDASERGAFMRFPGLVMAKLGRSRAASAN
ncbi:polysaccharide biosynthesis protein [Acetobacter nitrogenifigens DSM 23921 = NBRC 105050]|uniref:Putative O-antigen transporter n=1 Tax=Acetobacter nitrogenifigens DSM 23921 = NBRC 105050 TaxID=1120919 RepID=A0A511XCV4_9PROT|nr:flippase [Acetobacter nitrogenifigens]GBQ91695.1 polysaccharide biosynthesis protein [Acetobacter nitrogenifigens DSM 23921 = NBRC 105050]GEN60796.1 putative O-antigen transporter [Acetobacter nitrogenifigens DSM 23921 = NBRC 105050]